MATASQKMTLIRFLLVMRGARTAAPTSDEPVMKMPLFFARDENGAFESFTRARAWGGTIRCQTLLNERWTRENDVPRETSFLG